MTRPMMRTVEPELQTHPRLQLQEKAKHPPLPPKSLARRLHVVPARRIQPASHRRQQRGPAGAARGQAERLCPEKRHAGGGKNKK